jgi:hypothetical protein
VEQQHYGTVLLSLGWEAPLIPITFCTRLYPASNADHG